MDVAATSQMTTRPNDPDENVVSLLITKIDEIQSKVDRLETSENTMKRRITELETEREIDKQTTELLTSKIDSMQSKLDLLETSENALKQTIASLVKNDQRSADDIASLKNTIDRLETSDISTKERVAELEETLGNNFINAEENVEDDVPDYTQSNSETESNEAELSVPKERTVRKSTRSPQHVAFLVYLDHVVRTLGMLQTVVFNHVAFNEGNGYSSNTGIFRVPTTGVYLFSWSVTASKRPSEPGYDVRVKLMINGGHMVGAVAESRTTDYDDNQGSNTAVFRCNQGDEVWIQHSDGADLFGDEVIRSTSFTGVLLYI